jgi:hypothetical protein
VIQAHYLVSDFDPKVLILGDQVEFQAMKRFFQQFLEKDDFQADFQSVGVTQSNFELQTHKVKGLGRGLFKQGNVLILQLSQDQIQRYIDEIDEFLDMNSQAGSCILDLLIVDEIRIQLSFGEFDQDYFIGL